MWGRSLLQMLADAGFVEATIHGWTGYRTSSFTEGGLITARKPGGVMPLMAGGQSGPASH